MPPPCAYSGTSGLQDLNMGQRAFFIVYLLENIVGCPPDADE